MPRPALRCCLAAPASTLALAALLCAAPPFRPALAASAPTQPTALSELATQELQQFEKRVTVRKLPNGLTILLCERPEAPVFSYFTLVNAGDVDDPGGQSGLAHMFEHLAFKGTEEIGTTDWPAEKVALAKVEIAYAAYDAESRKRVGRDPEKLKQLKAEFEAARAAAQKYVVPNQFTQIAEENGAVGINAETGLDATQYFWSMPANRLALWAYMESARIAHPVPREFYKERDVVLEERRMRVDSSPIGRALEQFVGTAYIAHPYRRPNIGFESEVSQLSATEAAAFHAKFYTPPNIVIAVAGDVKPAESMPVIEKYFSAIPPGPRPEGIATIEPPQYAEKRITVPDPSQPFYIEGYHRPSYLDPDNQVYNAISDILSNGRVSRLYRSLVRDQQIAAEAEGFTGYPGDKYPQLFAFYAVPLPGHTPEQMRTAIHKEIQLLQTQDVTDAELAAFKTRAAADLLRSLDDNQGLAEQLAAYQTRYGDWRELFLQLKQIDAVTKADIRRVATAVFVESNRTSTSIITAAPPQNAAAQLGPAGAGR